MPQCTRCTNQAIGSPPPSSILPYHKGLCDDCNSSAASAAEPSNGEEFPFEEAEAEAVVKSSSSNAGVSAPEGSGEKMVGENDNVGGGLVDLTTEAGADEQPELPFEDYLRLQNDAISVDSRERNACESVMGLWRSADKLLSLKTLLQGGLGGASSCGAIYGELVITSMIDVLVALNLNHQDKFVDLGSGCGVPALLCSELGRIDAVGVEYHDTRNYMAQVLALEMLKKKVDNSNDDIHGHVAFGTRNFYDMDRLNPATKMFCFSTGMPPASLKSLVKLIASSSTLRSFALFHSFDDLMRAVPSFVDCGITRSYEMRASFSTRMIGSGAQHTCYVYSKTEEDLEEDGGSMLVDSDATCMACSAATTESKTCQYCEGYFCTEHIDVHASHGGLCDMFLIANEPTFSRAWHQTQVDDFNDKRGHRTLSLHSASTTNDGDAARKAEVVQALKNRLEAEAEESKAPFRDRAVYVESKVLEGTLVEVVPQSSVQVKGVYYYQAKDSGSSVFSFDNSSQLLFYNDYEVYDAVCTGRLGKKGQKHVDFAFTFPSLSTERDKVALQALKQIRSGSGLFIVVAELSSDGKVTSIEKVNAQKGLKFMFDNNMSLFDVSDDILRQCREFAESLDEFKPSTAETARHHQFLAEAHNRLVQGSGNFLGSRRRGTKRDDTDEEDKDEEGDIDTKESVKRFLASSQGQAVMQQAMAEASKSTNASTMKASKEGKALDKQVKVLDKKVQELQRSQLSEQDIITKLEDDKSELHGVFSDLMEQQVSQQVSKQLMQMQKQIDALDKNNNKATNKAKTPAQKQKVASPQRLNDTGPKSKKSSATDDASSSAVAAAAVAAADAASRAAESAATAAQAVAAAAAAAPSDRRTTYEAGVLVLHLEGATNLAGLDLKGFAAGAKK